jgi:hypothetical protein
MRLITSPRDDFEISNIVSNGQKKWEEVLALGLDEAKWRGIFKLPFIVAQNTKETPRQL